MAMDFITINRSSQGFGEMAVFLDELRKARDLSVSITGKLSHLATDPDYTKVAARYGITAAEGQALYNLVASVNGLLTNAAVPALLDRVG